MKYLLLVFIAINLASCTHISDVVPAGENTYLVTGSMEHSRSTGGEVKVELFKVANSYCSDIGKEVLAVKTSSTDAHLFRSSTAELYFRCINK